MARVRAINPGYFLDDELADCDPLARILFAGLWCVADREGRMKDRPRRIKAETLPYDDCDMDALLQELADHHFIHRYEVDGCKYIAIPTWQRYQNPHYREAESVIPAPSGQTWTDLEATSGQAWSNVESTLSQRRCNVARSSSSSSSNSSSQDASAQRRGKHRRASEMSDSKGKEPTKLDFKAAAERLKAARP